MEITHDIEKQKFFVVIDGFESHLEYTQSGNILNFNHTFVPNAHRGKGIAGKLVEAGLNYARENNFKVIPNCSYVASFIEKNDKYKDLLV